MSRSSHKIRLQLFSLLTLLFLGAALAFTAIPLFILSIEMDLGISHTLAGLLYGFLLAGSALGRFIEGFLVEHYGKVRFILVASFLLIVGFFSLSFAPTYSLVSFAICVIGLGNGLYFPVGYSMVSELFPQRRGRMIGIYDAMFPISGVVAYALNRVRFLLGSWRYGTLCIGIFLSITFVLFAFNRHVHSLELRSGSTASFSLRGRFSRMINAARNSYVFLTTLALIIPVGIVTFGLLNFLKVFLVQAVGFTVETADLIYLLYMVLGIVGKMLAGWMTDRVGARCTLLWIFGVESLGLAFLTFAPIRYLLFVGILFVGVSRSGVFTVIHTHLLGNLTKETVNLLYGSFMVVLVLAGSIGTPLTGLMIDTVGFMFSFTMLLAVLIGSFLIVLFFIE